jgi:hypothetical protein
MAMDEVVTIILDAADRRARKVIISNSELFLDLLPL